MGKNYIKLPVEILNSRVLGILPDDVFRKFIELNLVAGIQDEDGLLPHPEVIAWHLRTDQITLLTYLEQLQEKNILEIKDFRFFLPQFAKWNQPVITHKVAGYSKEENLQDAALYKRNRIKVWQRDMARCRYCKRILSKTDFHVDHIKPKIQGGNSNIHNLALACKSCNMSKGSRTPEEAGMVLHGIPT
jgi:hypothetical protein